MSKYKSLAALLTMMLAGGCASAPQTADNAEGAAATDPAVIAFADAAPVLQLDIEEFDSDPRHEIVCRQMLKPASNVIVQHCLSRDDWKQYERAEARHAQAMLRIMQGGAYR
jgi:hypothetical protein